MKGQNKMGIAKKIAYNGQCIEVVSEKSDKDDIYKYRIKYFPKECPEKKCAWKMLQCLIKFPKIDEATKEAKIRIDTEFENGNWVEPIRKIFKDCEDEK